MHAEGDAEEFPRLHNPEYTEPADPLHSLGKELLAEVGYLADHDNAGANVSSEVFGASEDESAEMDHSEDSENGRRSSFICFMSRALTSTEQPRKLRNCDKSPRR